MAYVLAFVAYVYRRFYVEPLTLTAGKSYGLPFGFPAKTFRYDLQRMV